MNYLKILLVVGAMAFGIQQSGATLSSGTLDQIISDDDATGYSTTINVTGVGALSAVTVTLNISGGFAGDLYAYLTHDGQTAILLNRIGTSGTGTIGNSSPGMNVTFSQAGSVNIHDASSGLSAITGTYLADGRYANPRDLGAVNGAGTTGHDLGNFVGHTGSGNWTLFIADVDGGAVSTLNSWQLEITEVPEPVNVALGIFGGGFVALQGFRFWKRKKRDSAAIP